ncbi:MAG TPA: histidine kinase dimerization/phospho-acceptor domain-containing protein [Methylomirabilota bacterium]|nr:histidine kinase dimerization/phospho-acceptor domain-containing protein [Methylomirabilota bacterium]
MRHGNVIVLTDEGEFASLLSSSWQAERRSPTITTLTSDLWETTSPPVPDLLIVGPLHEGKLRQVFRNFDPACPAILCDRQERPELPELRARYSKLVFLPLREDWACTLLLVAGETLRRVEAQRLARQSQRAALQSEHEAALGRYILEMRHSLSNALTSVLGNAELLLLEPGQLSSQSLQQIKTIHSMALRMTEIVQRFSTLASENSKTENASQAETEEHPLALTRRR